VPAIHEVPGTLWIVYGRRMDAADIAVLETRAEVPTDRLADLIGWTLKPEGLCRDERCVLVPDRRAVESPAGVDLTAIAGLLDRPVAVDDAAGLVAIGAEREQRRSALQDRKAPDFSLPDLDGTWHALSDHRSKKKLLVAFSSW
jgi:hypothetical protein